jgi:geranylgeranyl reductase family protein
MFDCIIVGSGPAGSSAAYHLAKKGRSVVIVEKESLPRYKPCGGGVSPIVQTWFDFDFSPVISLKVDQLSYTWNKTDPIEISLPDQEPIWMVRREFFDHFIVQQAQKQGAELRERTKAINIEFQSDRWLLQTTNDPLTGKYLIAADGAKGVMAKWLGFRKRQYKMAGALEAEIPLDHPNNYNLNLEFGLVKGGYLWNFPKADGYSVGVGTFKGSHRQDFRQIIQEYVTLFGIDDLTTAKQCGHPILIWENFQKLHTQNALLAGEAACVVDPFTAEGIRPSIFTGIKAAEAIDLALSGDLNALENYSEIINQEWGSEMVWAKRLAELFYRFPKIGYQVGVKRPTASIKMGQILAGQLKYSAVANSAIQKLTRAIVKI